MLGLLVTMVVVSIVVAAINDAFFEEGEPLEKYAQRWAEIKAGKVAAAYEKENNISDDDRERDSEVREIYNAALKEEYDAIMARGS